MAEFTRLPDGSLVLRQAPPPPVTYYNTRQPTFGQFLKEKLSGLLPNRFEPKPAPWWIPQEGAAAAPAMPPVPQNVQRGRIDPFAEVEAEVNKEEKLARELGAFSKAVMDSPELIQGKWLSSPIRK